MKKTVSLRLSVSMYKHLHTLSREAGLSLSAMIEQRLSCVEDNLQIQSLQDRLDRLSILVDRMKVSPPNPIVIELLKEIAIRLDSRIPSIVKSRLTQRGESNE